MGPGLTLIRQICRCGQLGKGFAKALAALPPANIGNLGHKEKRRGRVGIGSNYFRRGLRESELAEVWTHGAILPSPDDLDFLQRGPVLFPGEHDLKVAVQMIRSRAN